MSDFKILNDLLREAAIIKQYTGAYGKPTVMLEERKQRLHRAYAVEISNIPSNAIVIKTDLLPDNGNFFNGTKGECKRADFVIIAHKQVGNNVKKLIVIIELKESNSGTEKEIIQQLKGSQCVIEYFRSIGNIFWKKNDFLNKNEYEFRFVLFNHIRINKRTTTNKQDIGKHDSPKQMLKISSPNRVEFNQLVGTF